MAKVCILVLALCLMPAAAWADVAWFAAPYVRVPSTRLILRACAMNDYTASIRADGGDWKEVEILGNVCLVKVRASAITIATISADIRFRKFQKNALNLSLSDLTSTQKTALRNFVLSLGYTSAEIQAALGSDLGAVTLRDVLRFIASRRRMPRYDQATDTIVVDGSDHPTGDVDALEASIQ